MFIPEYTKKLTPFIAKTIYKTLRFIC